MCCCCVFHVFLIYYYNHLYHLTSHSPTFLHFIYQDWQLEFGADCKYRASPFESKCVGENTFSTYSKDLAYALGYTNPKTNTGHGTRVGALSLLGNSNCGPGTLKGASRHGDSKMTGSYHKPNMEDRIRGSCALQMLNADELALNGTIGMFQSVLCPLLLLFLYS